MRVEAGRNACGLIDVGPFFRALFFRLLNPPFHVTQRFEIVVDLRVVCRSELLLKLFHTGRHGIENAPVLMKARRAHARVGAVARPE